MNCYIVAFLLLQCFFGTWQSNARNPAQTTQLTWREIFPDYCGLRYGWLKEKLVELKKATPSEYDGTKISQADYTTIEDHPWQVALLTTYNKTCLCGGSIISKYHVLTAAHCLMKTTSTAIRGALYKSTSLVPYTSLMLAVGNTRHAEASLFYNISEVHIHDFYAGSHQRNDIALIKIDKEFVWTEFVWPICLPTEDESYESHRECMISGFGALRFKKPNPDGMLRMGRVTIKREEVCKAQMTRYTISEGMFCAGGKVVNDEAVDSCKGDSGGPLSCSHIDTNKRQVLLGIVSFGIECGLPNKPGAYMKVSKYIKWIHDWAEVLLGSRARGSMPEDEDIGRPTIISNEV